MILRWLPIIVILILASCLNAAIHAETLSVTASILPIADWARNVGGDRVSVTCVLSAGSSPHTFAPSPSDVKHLASADVFLMVGVGLEEWAEKFVSAAGRPTLKVCRLGEAIGYKAGDNPHLWLDPVLAERMVKEIARIFSQMEPASAPLFQQNAETYMQRLSSLHERFDARFKQLTGRKVVQFHPAFTYLLRRYGIGELDIIEHHPGKSPNSRHLQKIIVALRKEKRRVVLMEPQLSSKAAATVAKESQAKLLVLDPLGDPTIEERSTYLKLMEFNLDNLLINLK
ncbi:MAG: zinc ABC transporter substrate-binding protein [Candidatus Coatesbacteria bacterium]|nr:zinc ABC transporter substrate-binding protein [Candidatus Coatesbacteria bacterium]